VGPRHPIFPTAPRIISPAHEPFSPTGGTRLTRGAPPPLPEDAIDRAMEATQTGVVWDRTNARTVCRTCRGAVEYKSAREIGSIQNIKSEVNLSANRVVLWGLHAAGALHCGLLIWKVPTDAGHANFAAQFKCVFCSVRGTSCRCDSFLPSLKYIKVASFRVSTSPRSWAQIPPRAAGAHANHTVQHPSSYWPLTRSIQLAVCCLVGGHPNSCCVSTARCAVFRQPEPER